jgi:D-alanyl-D-alanine carboxypeptidase
MNWTKAIKGFTLSLIFLSIAFFSIQGMWSVVQSKDLFLGSILDSVSGKSQEILEEEKLKEKDVSGEEIEFPQRDWSVQDLFLVAESGTVAEISKEGKEKILFRKNSSSVLPVASLTKLMTAVVSIENYNLTDMIFIGENAVAQFGSRGPLGLRNAMTVSDLLYIMLIESSNQAAFALSEGMGMSLTQNYQGEGTEKFVKAMNQKAREIGMLSTFFEEPTGLSSRNVSTAGDLVKLSKYILENHPEIIRISKIEEIDLPGYGTIINTNQLLGENPDIMGGKTGFTIDANGCLLLIINNSKAGDYLIYVVLGAGDRFLEMKKMIDWIGSAYIWQK